ncbi:uncharacterized protein LOC109821212 [Asparagus officinalis]|uniref:uncharacterized protein LOC109821212 n=1 Tax=Asparagus officinalis TaxID=4686 RepID=UPI00098E57DA|nr:uncharacterized protein LOC109821212 [Asparagus officinalis]
MIKYLFKYVHKGPDLATRIMNNKLAHDKDEIHQYLDARYISAAEAAWRLFDYNLHRRYPPVERLRYHLPYEQEIYFHDNRCIENVVQSERCLKTMLTEWFIANQTFENAKDLLYTEFPQKFIWNRQLLAWLPRKKSFAIGRLPFAQPVSGERYYLRMLLNIVRGATSYEFLRTVDNVLHPTFKSACLAMGLLEDDK